MTTEESTPRPFEGQPDPRSVVPAAEAVSVVRAGSVLLVGGWGGIGIPKTLVSAVGRSGVGDLVLVSNNCGMGMPGDVGELFRNGQVRKVLASFPTHPKATEFRDRFEKGELEIEIVPQGTLAERLRAAGSGIGGFFTKTAAGTLLSAGKEVRVIDGHEHLLEEPLHGDVALVRGWLADEAGNLRFRYGSRGLNPVMAMAARTTLVEVDRVVPRGEIHPDDVHLPGIFVDALVESREES